LAPPVDVHRGHTPDRRSTIRLMKKLLILAIIVALGVVAAKRLRPS
jgi:hypothetical protein